MRNQLESNLISLKTREETLHQKAMLIIKKLHSSKTNSTFFQKISSLIKSQIYNNLIVILTKIIISIFSRLKFHHLYHRGQEAHKKFKRTHKFISKMTKFLRRKHKVMIEINCRQPTKINQHLCFAKTTKIISCHKALR